MIAWALSLLCLLFLNFCFRRSRKEYVTTSENPREERRLTLKVMCFFYEVNVLPGKCILSLSLT